MSRLTSEPRNKPDRERFEPERPKRKKKSLRQRLAKQVAMGILCSCIATAFYNIAPIKRAVLWICSVVVHVGGDPISGEGGIIPKIKGGIDDIKTHPGLPIAGAAPGGLSGLGHKSPEQLKLAAKLKETERKRKEESERRELFARADVLGLEYEEVWPLEKLRIEVHKAEKEAREEKARAEEEARKKPLITRADKIGLQLDPTADYKTLKHQVEEGEKEVAAVAEYQAMLRQHERNMEEWRNRVATGPNARCPNPKCRHAMRFNQSRIGTQFICSSCNGIFPVRMAMARWTPPPPPREPQRPKKNPSLWKRIFG